MSLDDFTSSIFKDYMGGSMPGLTHNMEFDDMFPNNGKTLDASPQDFEVDLDSPMSLEFRDDVNIGMFGRTNSGSVSSLLGDDNINSSYPPASSPSLLGDDQSDVSSVRAISPNNDLQAISPNNSEGASTSGTALVIEDEDYLIAQDKLLISIKMEDKLILPPNNGWSLGQRIDRLMAVSPCKKYTKEFLMQLEEVEDQEKRVDILIEFVHRIKQEFAWNHVNPKELRSAYTSASNCKKGMKTDTDGNPIPKRPMNAFMIWSKQCRSFISQICPALHNAIISRRLGNWWKKIPDDEKSLLEAEKFKLLAFHKIEFPNYKYKPQKKAAKKNEQKTEEAAKEKPSTSRKRKSPSTKQSKPSPPQPQQQPPLRGINISEPRANLDPALQRKLQSKMNVKIDPNMRRDVSLSQGNCLTGVNLTDLPISRSSSSSPLAKRLCLQPIEVQQHTVPPTTIDLADTANSSTVFDTPGNSPHSPVTPVTPNEPILGAVPINSQGQRCFDFTSLPATSVPVLVEQLASTSANNNNNNSIFFTSTGGRLVFPVSVGSLQKASDFQNNIRIVPVSEQNNNNNVVINNNNALLHNNNVNVKSEPLLIQRLVKSEPFVLQSNSVAVKPEPLFLQTDNLALQRDPPIMQANEIVKHEPISPQPWSISVKTEADHFCPIVKSEPEVNNELSMPPSSGLDLGSIQDLPMLSAETVDEVLEASITSYSNENLLNDIMNLPAMRDSFLIPPTV